jgi:uncharacterized protein (TIGR00730 family)
MATELGKKLAAREYMVITGGGPGIMQAVNEGAGADRSFGVSIRLPFEQKSNGILEGDPKNIMYKYFFNRKVAFLKESDAIVLFPGGFGTQDEGMEALTLLRLNTEIKDGKIDDLKEKFADILTANGDMWLSGPFSQENNEPEIKHLPRLVIDFNLNDFGRLKALINEINRD